MLSSEGKIHAHTKNEIISVLFTHRHIISCTFYSIVMYYYYICSKYP